MHIPHVHEITHDIEVIIHAVEEKEEIILHMFEETWWPHMHEHWLLHTGEMIFTRVMMLSGI